MNDKRNLKRQGHDCSYVWWGRKFIAVMRESVARGRDTRHGRIELGHVRRGGGDRGETNQEARKVQGRRKGPKNDQHSKLAGLQKGSWEKGTQPKG